jgi:flavin-dependent dehydrogenase
VAGVRTVCVLGGGPAGAGAARLLALWGHDVRLVTRPAGERRLAVSLPPSTAKLFETLSVNHSIERAGFIRSTGNTVWWGGGDPRVERFAPGAQGWQVELARLSETMLACAGEAGVRIERAAAEATPDSEAFVLDCTGRTGVLARAKDLRVYHDGPRTIALTAEWRTGPAWAVPDDTHTIVESYGDGWMWSVPVAAGVRHVAAMIDPERSELARGGSAGHIYRAEVAKTREFKRLLADATLHAGPWGFDASPYGARGYSGDGWLLVGDAGSFIDPLSSAGVKKALASAWLAAVVTHTCLANPPMQPHALAFYEARERAIAQHYVAASRAFLRDAARGHLAGFWASRSAAPGESARDDDLVKAAFERLKAAGAVRLTTSDAATIEERPFVAGHEILLGPHLVTPDAPGGIRHLHGVDLLALLELAGGLTPVPDLYEAYARQVSPVPLPDFLLAVSTAIARGLVVTE